MVEGGFAGETMAPCRPGYAWANKERQQRGAAWFQTAWQPSFFYKAF
jgi:hypothetical protein